MAQTIVNIPMNEDLKRNFDNLCDDLGLTTAEAFTMLVNAAVMRQGMPFGHWPKTPNAETLAAIAEIEDMERNPHLYKSFSSVEELFADLNDDEDLGDDE